MVAIRTFAALAALALCLAGCGGASRDPSTTATPLFASGSPAPPAQPDPAPSSVPAGTGPAEATAAPTASASARPEVRYVFPVRAADVSFHPTHGKYPATDLFADCGAPVVAPTGGVILEVSRTDRYVEGSPDGPRNGGLSVSLLGDDGVRYYGSHLRVVQSGITAGVRVTAGQRLGEVGRTGNANNVCHLHFGISPPCARTGDWKVRRGVIWPAPYLRSWRADGARSPAAAVAAWARTHDCTA